MPEENENNAIEQRRKMLEGLRADRERHLSGLKYPPADYDLWRSIAYRMKREKRGN